jgi:hypothetical protein
MAGVKEISTTKLVYFLEIMSKIVNIYILISFANKTKSNGCFGDGSVQNQIKSNQINKGIKSLIFFHIYVVCICF